MRPVIFLGLILLALAPVQAQQALYGLHWGDQGLTVTLGGKTWGPFQKLEAQSYSRGGQRVVLVVRGPSGLQVLTNEGLAASFPPEFSLETLKVAPDGRSWALAAGNGEVHQVWAGGKVWGPYPSLAAVEVSDGGQWLLAVKPTEDSAQVWVNGESQGKWEDVPFATLAPSGDFWAFVGIRGEKTFFVTSQKTWGPLAFANTDALAWSSPVWGFSVGDGEGNLTWVVRGREFPGYQFSGPLLTLTGGHWAFEAVKKSGLGFVVIDGKEYPGHNLVANPGEGQWTWLENTGDQVYLRALKP